MAIASRSFAQLCLNPAESGYVSALAQKEAATHATGTARGLYSMQAQQISEKQLRRTAELFAKAEQDLRATVSSAGHRLALSPEFAETQALYSIALLRKNDRLSEQASVY
jgi:hypothetical protein